MTPLEKLAVKKALTSAIARKLKGGEISLSKFWKNFSGKNLSKAERGEFAASLKRGHDRTPRDDRRLLKLEDFVDAQRRKRDVARGAFWKKDK